MPPRIYSGEGCRIASSVKITGEGKLVLGDWVAIEDNVLIDLSGVTNSVVSIGPRSKVKYGAVLRTYGGSIAIGTRVSIGEYTLLAAHGGIVVEDSVIIANHCSLNASEHIIGGYDAPIRYQGERHLPIKVGLGAWIGASVTVMAGVDIQQGAVIGANSTVTRSLPSWTVSYGSPARPIKSYSHPDQP